MPITKESAEKAPLSFPRRYKVFVSSTYLDNVERRKVVEEAITMADMVWHGMEIFTATTRPTVDECLRYAREADVLVGIIAWCYGWIPEDSDTSITEMEYDAARERLMFVPQSTVFDSEKDCDPGPEKWIKQDKLAAFKARLSLDQMPARFTETNLGAKVLKALQDWRADREGDGEPLEEEIRRYCLKAGAVHAKLPVTGFVTELRVSIDIEDIYIPLRAMVDLRPVADKCFADADHAEKALRECDAAIEISLPEAFRQLEMRCRRGVVILGDPGSGKTTHLKRLLLWCLPGGRKNTSLPADILPVFLPLRDLRDLDHGLEAFIQSQLDSPHLQTRRGFGDRLLNRGNLLFLLDGLDEVADLPLRERVARWIGDALKSHPTCLFVVTSRFAGYSPSVRLSEDFLEMHIRPLSGDQMERFVTNWYRIVEKELGKDPEQAEGIAREKADNLIEKLREPEFRARRVFELTRNPLLLTNICLVHRHQGGLPHKRAQLYEECIEVLLERWRKTSAYRSASAPKPGGACCSRRPCGSTARRGEPERRRLNWRPISSRL